jgi:hypothetical protein
VALAFHDVCQYACYEKYAHQVSQSRITAPRKVARKECRVYAEQTGPQRSPEGKTRQSSTFASRHSEIWILDITEQRKICESKSRPRSLLSQTTTSVSYTYIDVHQNQLEALDTVAVARLPGVNVIEERRQRSETPPRRRTRSRTDSRSTQGAFWTNTGRQSRRDVPDVPEPPAPPPRRQTGVQWLHSGAWQPNPAPPTNRNSGRGYFQPPYF